MNNAKANVLSQKLDALDRQSPFYVDVRWQGSRKNIIAQVDVGIRPVTVEDFNRRTFSVSGRVQIIVFETLTDIEKNLICRMLCKIAQETGLKNPKLLKISDTPYLKHLLVYMFR